MIVIELSGEPVGKGRPRFSTARGKMRTYTPQKTSAYETELQIEALKVYGVSVAPLEGPIRMNIIAVLILPKSLTGMKKILAGAGVLRPCKRPDIDNIIKLASDALNGIIYKDDCQVVEGSFKKIYAERPFLRIEIETIGDKDAYSKTP